MNISRKDVITWSALAVLAVCVFLLWQKGQPTRSFQHMLQHENTEYGTIDMPKIVFFAGERCPLEREEIAERFDHELHINKFWKSNTYLMLKRIDRWFPMIEKILEEEGVPTDLKYLAVAETMLQNLESPAGAAGFWQLMPETATSLGLRIDEEVDERYDPVKSTRAAAKYLKNARKKFKSWTDVVASYNRGVNGYQRALDKQKVDHFYELRLNSETARYVFRVLALKEIIEHPEKYGFKLDRKHRYAPIKTYQITVDTSITDLVQFAHDQQITYKTLREHNPWLLDYSLTNPNRKKMRIVIPKEKDYVAKPEVSDTTEVKSDASVATPK